jgi:hypothetical protein
MPTSAWIAAAVALAATVALVGCSGQHKVSATASLATISQRYETSVDPAHASLNAAVSRMLAYQGGSTSDVDAALPPTVNILRRAAGQLNAISAPAPIRLDIVDVAKAMTVVVADLNALSAARGSDVQPAIALVVADAGRESAADNLVRLALAQPTQAAATPTPEVPVVAVTTVPDTTTTQSATVPARSTTTTRLTTTTAVARTSTTSKPTTTLKTP